MVQQMHIRPLGHPPRHHSALGYRRVHLCGRPVLSVWRVAHRAEVEKLLGELRHDNAVVEQDGHLAFGGGVLVEQPLVVCWPVAEVLPAAGAVALAVLSASPADAIEVGILRVGRRREQRIAVGSLGKEGIEHDSVRFVRQWS